MLKWIVIGVAAVVIAAAAFFYVGMRSGTAKLDVCQGDDRPNCTGSEHFITCSTDVIQWAKTVRPDVCIDVTTRKVSEKPGKVCSYATFEISCSKK
jgi:hypothetical protein